MIRDNQREISSRANYRVDSLASAQRAATRTDEEEEDGRKEGTKGVERKGEERILFRCSAARASDRFFDRDLWSLVR